MLRADPGEIRDDASKLGVRLRRGIFRLEQQRGHGERADGFGMDAALAERFDHRRAQPRGVDAVQLVVGRDHGAQIVAERWIDGRQIVGRADAHRQHGLSRPHALRRQPIDEIGM